MDQTKIINKTLRDIKDTLSTLKGGFSPEQFSDVLALVVKHLEKPKGDTGEKGATGEQGLQGEKGDKGEQGIEGKTPQRGLDYYTEEDIRVLLDKIAPLIHSYNETTKKEVIDTAISKVKAGIVIPEFSLKDEDWIKVRTQIEEILKESSPNIDLSQYIIGVGVKTITVGPTAPVNPQEGDLWVRPRRGV